MALHESKNKESLLKLFKEELKNTKVGEQIALYMATILFALSIYQYSTDEIELTQPASAVVSSEVPQSPILSDSGKDEPEWAKRHPLYTQQGSLAVVVKQQSAHLPVDQLSANDTELVQIFSLQHSEWNGEEVFYFIGKAVDMHQDGAGYSISEDDQDGYTVSQVIEILSPNSFPQ